MTNPQIYVILIVMRRYKLPDYLAHYLGGLLPHRNPRFNKMTDADFITVISWCEDWEPEKVYNTAYKESHLDYLLTWEECSKDMQSLPMPVRAELERALKIHVDAGNVQALRAYAYFYEGTQTLAKYAFWIFIATMFLFWIGS